MGPYIILAGAWALCIGVVLWERVSERRAVRRSDMLDMLDAEADATWDAWRVDEAEREAQFRRLTDPDRIDWDSPRVQAGVDRLIAEIRAQDLLDRIHDLDAERVIDLRDNQDGAR
jgi:hypothetical protein